MSAFGLSSISIIRLRHQTLQLLFLLCRMLMKEDSYFSFLLVSSVTTTVLYSLARSLFLMCFAVFVLFRYDQVPLLLQLRAAALFSSALFQIKPRQISKKSVHPNSIARTAITFNIRFAVCDKISEEDRRISIKLSKRSKSSSPLIHIIYTVLSILI